MTVNSEVTMTTDTRRLSRREWILAAFCGAMILAGASIALTSAPSHAQIAPSPASDWTRPMTGGFAITPSDSTNFTYIARGVYVGTGGNVVVVFMDDTSATFANVPSGAVLPVMAKRVNSTSTTASNLIGGL